MKQSPEDLLKVVQIMPAGGWWIKWHEDPAAYKGSPLVGWGLTADGQVVPIDTDEHGDADPLYSPGDYTIFHPEVER